MTAFDVIQQPFELPGAPGRAPMKRLLRTMLLPCCVLVTQTEHVDERPQRPGAAVNPPTQRSVP